MTTVSGAVLVGGSGLRLGGVDKAALIVGGVSLLERQLALLTPRCRERLVIGGAVRALPPDVRALADEAAGQGPLGGVAAALAGAAHDDVLILAVDLPALTDAALAAILQAALAAPAAHAVVPRHDGGALEPLCALWRRAALPVVRAHLAAGQRALHRVLGDAALTVAHVAVAALGGPGVLANVNTRDDLARWPR